MAEPTRQPISRVDTAWLRMEQPTNLMMITGVIVCDGPLDHAALLNTLEHRLLVYARFRQKAVDGVAGAYWEEDDDFDLRHHVRRTALPGDAGRAELEDLVAELASTPLPPSRPLWQFHVVENYAEGPALVVRIHHCIADGIALVQVFLSLTDADPDDQARVAPPCPESTAPATEAPVFRRLLEPAMGGLDAAWQGSMKAVDEGIRLIQDPARAGRLAIEAGDIVGELAQALALPDDPGTQLKGRLGVGKRAAWASPLPLAEVKAVSASFGCTVNDVLIAAVSGALRRYLLECNETESEVPDVRATVPVNLRPLEHAAELGNHFGLVFLDLPLSSDNPLERLYRVADHMDELKASKQAAMTFGVLAALGMAPAALQKPVLDYLSGKASMVLTNVPGPQQPLYLAGARLRELMFWVPQNGGIGLGVSIFSYDQKVFFGLMADRLRVPDPHDVVSRFRAEFEKLLHLAMLLPPGATPGLAQALLERDG